MGEGAGGVEWEGLACLSFEEIANFAMVRSTCGRVAARWSALRTGTHWGGGGLVLRASVGCARGEVVLLIPQAQHSPMKSAGR